MVTTPDTPTGATSAALAEPLVPVAAPEPPSRDLTPAQWVRSNLFSSPASGVLTVVAGVITAYALFRLARWAFVTSDWEIVRANLRLFMVGRFPSDQLWRTWASGYVLAVALGLASGVLLAGTAARPAGAVAPTPAPADPDGGTPSSGADAPAGGAVTTADAAPTAAPAGGPTAGPGAAVATDELAGDPPAVAPASSAVEAADAPVDRGLWGLVHRFWPLAVAGVLVLSLTRTFLPTVLTAVLVALFVGARFVGSHAPAGFRRWSWAVMALGIVAALLVITAVGGVAWDRWGGLHLNMAAAIAGIALAFPLGLLLALGRRSSLPGLRWVSVAYIEMFRAVPLVALLFVSRYMIGFLFPTSVEPPSYLVRAVIVITLFEAAYIAEIVRGGLQAVPKGQVEAAQAVGLRPPGVLRLVVLPQALRAVIPAMVGQFISLFKDTSLLSVVTFLEMTAVAEVATEQDAFRGQGGQVVTLTFVGILFWAGCSTMARESRRLERRLGVGER